MWPRERGPLAARMPRLTLAQMRSADCIGQCPMLRAKRKAYCSYRVLLSLAKLGHRGKQVVVRRTTSRNPPICRSCIPCECHSAKLRLQELTIVQGSPRHGCSPWGQMVQAMERSDGRAPCLWQRETGWSKRRIEQEKPALGPRDTSGDVPTSGGKERGSATGKFRLLFCSLRRLATHDVPARQGGAYRPRRALR